MSDSTEFATVMRAANTALNAKDTAHALQLLVTAQQLDSGNTDVHFNRSVACKQLGNRELPFAALEAALALEAAAGTPFRRLQFRHRTD